VDFYLYMGHGFRGYLVLRKTMNLRFYHIQTCHWIWRLSFRLFYCLFHGKPWSIL